MKPIIFGREFYFWPWFGPQIYLLKPNGADLWLGYDDTKSARSSVSVMGQREAAEARTAAAARDFQGSGSGRGSDVMKNGGSGSGRGSDIMKKGGSGSGRGSDVIIAARRAAIIIAAQVLISTFCSPILSLFSSLLSIPAILFCMVFQNHVHIWSPEFF